MLQVPVFGCFRLYFLRLRVWLAVVAMMFSTGAYALDRAEIKAALLFNFALETYWLEEGDGPITFAVFGDQPVLYDFLKSGLKGKEIRGMPIRVVQVSDVDSLSAPALLVFDKAQSDLAAQLIPTLKDKHILIITDNFDDRTLVMINLLDTPAGNLRFEVNRPNLLRERLQLQSDILLLGGTELDVVELFRQTEQKLKTTQAEVEVLAQQLSKANQDLEAINKKISARALALSEKNVELRKAEQEVEKKARDISARESAVAKLDKQLESLGHDAAVAQEAAVESGRVAKAALEQAQQSRIERDRTLQSLEKVRQEIAVRQTELEKLSIRLSQETETTRRQQDVINQQLFLLVVVGIALTIGVVSLVLLTRNRQLLAQKVEELNEARSQAETASSAKSQFLATMSHEIRTPMNAIIGLAEVLRDGQLDKNDREKAQIIYDSARGLMRILNDILDFSKIEAGKMDIELEPFEVESMVRDTVEMFRHIARDKGVSLVVKLGDSVPPRLTGDRQRIQQMLSNLISNAIKFTEDGQILVQVKWRRKALSLSVTDTGMGMSQEDLTHLFDEFVQVRAQRLRPEGTGLGLAICKRLTDLMGGTISVKSEPGTGSQFTIELPLAVSDKSFDNPQDGVKSETLPSLNIWVAEDNPVNQKVILSLCEKLGQSPILFDNGQLIYEAYCEDQSADLILMDCEMPVLDGWDTTRAIRDFEIAQGVAPIHIVALTAHAMKEFTDACYEAGMNAVLQKPITLELLNNSLMDASRLLESSQ